jgi:selenocysteine-specific elongation factor
MKPQRSRSIHSPGRRQRRGGETKTRSIPPGGEREALAVLCREKGTAGLRDRDLQDLSYLSDESLLRLSEELEAEGRVKILSFAPLFLISQDSFDYLCQKIVAYLEQFHEKNPSRKGVPLEKIKRRFDLSEKTLLLAVKALERTGKVRLARRMLRLPSHEAVLSPQEEKILRRLEETCYRGGSQSVSPDSIRKELRLGAERLDRLLSILVERKKVIQGTEGLLVHSVWLDEIIGRVRALGKKELSVGEFKTLTGLSRKYAIPLLELLDQMGVTRRRGPIREIL